MISLKTAEYIDNKARLFYHCYFENTHIKQHKYFKFRIFVYSVLIYCKSLFKLKKKMLKRH